MINGWRSTQPLHDLVADFVIVPDLLDVVILVERVDQLEQGRGIAFADFDRQVGLPRQLDALGLAQSGLERLGDSCMPSMPVQIVWPSSPLSTSSAPA